MICLSSPSSADTPDQLAKALDATIDINALKSGIVGAIVERISDGEVLYSRNPDIRLMPASNRKLFTSAAALELLGPGYVLKTDLLCTHTLSGTTIDGNIYLKGAGDALLSPADLEKMSQTLKQAGVTHVTGHVVGDGTIFQDGPYGDGWSWNYLSDYYAAQISGLEVSQGVLAVHVKPGENVGDRVAVTVDQPTAYLPIVNNATTTAKGSPEEDCRIFRPWDKNILIVEGSVPIGGKADGLVTVQNPSLYAATVLTETLSRDSVVVDGIPITASTPSDATVVLAEHSSLPMSRYIAKMNKPSDNLMAESLVRLVGAIKGKGGTYYQGHEVEMQFFKSLGIDTDPLQLLDGSGLTRYNYVTARSVGQLLTAMHHRPDWKAYYDSLPIAGVDGSLAGRMKSTKAAGNVHAKTGWIGWACNLSGYVTGHDGQIYVFSLLMNNYSGGEEEVYASQNRFVETLANEL